MVDPTLAPTQPGSEEDRSAFLSDLASAMHEKADLAHDRLLNGLEERSAAHVDMVRARSEEESAGLRDRADGDIAEIRAWSEAEIERVHDEAERRIESRRQVLAQELSSHDALVSREIDAVQGAVDRHRDELADYFRRLKGASEPTTIARLAGSIPLAPSLADVGTAARAAASTPTPAVEAATPDAVETQQSIQEPPAADAPAVEQAVETPAEAEPVAAEAVAEAPVEAIAEMTAEPVAADAVAEAPVEPAIAEMTAEPVAADAVAEAPVEAIAEMTAEPVAADAEPVLADEDVAVTPERLMGVMDPQATAQAGGPPKLPPWAVRLDDLEPSAPVPTMDAETAPMVEAFAVAAGPTADPAPPAPPEPVAAAAVSETHGAAEAPHGLLGSIPVLRPVGSWWNRANGNGSNGDHGED